MRVSISWATALIAILTLAACSRSPEDFGSEAHKNACGYLHFLGSALDSSLAAAALDRDYQTAQTQLSSVENVGPPAELSSDDRGFLDAYREDVTSALSGISDGESVNVSESQQAAREAWDDKWSCSDATGLERWDQIE